MKSLRKLMKSNNGQLKYGFFSEALKNTMIVKDPNRAYLLRYWINYWLKKRRPGLTIQNLNIEILNAIITEWEKLIQINNSRMRIIYEPSPNRMHPVNQYVYTPLRNYLIDLDAKGYSLTARAKFVAYCEIIEDPNSFQKYGAVIPCPYSLSQIPDTVRNHYDSCAFLRNIYKTKRKRVEKSKMSREQKYLKVIHYSFANQSLQPTGYSNISTKNIHQRCLWKTKIQSSKYLRQIWKCSDFCRHHTAAFKSFRNSTLASRLVIDFTATCIWD